MAVEENKPFIPVLLGQDTPVPALLRSRSRLGLEQFDHLVEAVYGRTSKPPLGPTRKESTVYPFVIRLHSTETGEIGISAVSETGESIEEVRVRPGAAFVFSYMKFLRNRPSGSRLVGAKEAVTQRERDLVELGRVVGKVVFPESISLRLQELIRKASGEGGGEEGVFVGDGQTLSPVAVVGDPLSGGTITDISRDFAYSGDVMNIIAIPSNGLRGIYNIDATGSSKIIEFGQPAPGGGVFSTISSVSRQGDNLAYETNISFGPGVNGVLTRIGGVNELVADTTTVIPGSEPTVFTGGSFSDPDISGRNVAFRGGASALGGVYARIDGTLVKVADRNDIQPGSVKPFSTFSVPVISGEQVAFRGVGDFAGIYVGDGGPLTVIAQTGDPAPGGSTFNGFAQNVSTDGEAVAFSGAGSGFIGLFVSDPSGLCRVIDTNDTLEGEDVTQLFMGRDSYSEGMLSFQAVFFDGRRGIYLAKATPRRAEIIGNWRSGIWYWDVAESEWTQMATNNPDGDIAAGDFTGDGKADVASIWNSGLWYQDGATLDWTKVKGSAPVSLTAGDVNGDGWSEIIGTWSSGIWYWDVAASKWTKMTSDTPTGDIAAGEFTGDGKLDVAGIFGSGLWYQDGVSLVWTKVGTAPDSLTAGDVTGDGRSEIIGTWSSGIWYWDVAASKWTKMTSNTPTGDIAAGDFTGDGKADVAGIFDSGLWYQDGASLAWTKVGTAPDRLTAGDVTGK